MKKIAYLTTHFPVLSETFVGNEIRAIQRLKHDIELVAFEPSLGPAQADDLILFKRLFILKKVSSVATLSRLLFSPFGLHSAMQFVNQQTGLPKRSLLWYGAKLAAHVKQTDCQHIHAHFGLASTATAIVAAKLAGVSVSFTCHGYDMYLSPADLTLKLQSANFTVAVCNTMQQDMLSLSPKSNIIRVRCGVDVSQLDDKMSAPNYSSQRLLYLGRLSATKGVSVLMEALSIMPIEQRPFIDVVGDGPLKSELVETCKTLGLTHWVSFLGAKPATWLGQHYGDYRALVAPFVITPEGVEDTGPLVIKEAMMYSLPVLTTDVSSCQEMLLDDHNKMANLGIMVKWGDPLALSQGLSKMMAYSPDTLRSMGTTGHQYLLSHFVIDDQVKHLSNAFETCQGEVQYV
ncbi:glycosyltransferase family 4 protein [Marinomonas algicola]|uniref:glycosyltransferase family 4 protein n=1 Tax=Marinomonas algicola TaxID=2773454 RepID=UPI00174EC1B9|nr:glycosyltransferase family 4 protein [Marinomonas algicola]